MARNYYDPGTVEPIFVDPIIAKDRKAGDEVVKRKGRQEDSQTATIARAQELKDKINAAEDALVMTPSVDFIQLLKQDLDYALNAYEQLKQAGGAA